MAFYLNQKLYVFDNIKKKLIYQIHSKTCYKNKNNQILKLGHILEGKTPQMENNGAKVDNFKFVYSQDGKEKGSMVLNQVSFYYNYSTTNYTIFEENNIFTADKFDINNTANIDFTRRGSHLVYKESLTNYIKVFLTTSYN